MPGRNKDCSIEFDKFDEQQKSHLEPMADINNFIDTNISDNTNNLHAQKTKRATLQKIFNNIDAKMTNTKVPNSKLMKYIKSKIHEKREFQRYDFTEDSNLYSLRFMIYLLIDEIEKIINNIDGKSGMSKLVEFDKKLKKRNDIVNYLQREKSIFAKFMSKILGIQEYGEKSVIEVNRKIIKMKPFPGKQDIQDNLSNMKNDYASCETFKNFSQEYFTDSDYENLLKTQENQSKLLNDPNFKFIHNLHNSFEKLKSHNTLQQDYENAVKEIDEKSLDYCNLQEKYEYLVDDFVKYTKDNEIPRLDSQISLGDSEMSAQRTYVEEVIRAKHGNDTKVLNAFKKNSKKNKKGNYDSGKNQGINSRSKIPDNMEDENIPATVKKPQKNDKPRKSDNQANTKNFEKNRNNPNGSDQLIPHDINSRLENSSKRIQSDQYIDPQELKRELEELQKKLDLISDSELNATQVRKSSKKAPVNFSNANPDMESYVQLNMYEIQPSKTSPTISQHPISNKNSEKNNSKKKSSKKASKDYLNSEISTNRDYKELSPRPESNNGLNLSDMLIEQEMNSNKREKRQSDKSKKEELQGFDESFGEPDFGKGEEKLNLEANIGQDLELDPEDDRLINTKDTFNIDNNMQFDLNLDVPANNDLGDFNLGENNKNSSDNNRGLVATSDDDYIRADFNLMMQNKGNDFELNIDSARNEFDPLTFEIGGDTEVGGLKSLAGPSNNHEESSDLVL